MFMMHGSLYLVFPEDTITNTGSDWGAQSAILGTDIRDNQ